ncbi:MAG TPA: serine/threonine-protein kinase [Burkholderiales bacterium]|nr:serine/threonine-protein kinase [Burkholderiales bacterium]
MLPEKIGRYEILAELGRGAMGVVYKAFDPLLDRAVAIKTLNLSFSDEELSEYEARFYQEAKAMGKITHPNIISLFDVGRSGDHAYITMEYLEGQELRKILDSGNRPGVERIIDIIRQVAEGLSYAHQHNIVHRDIKPSNIMILRSGVVKIADFGIARIPSSAIKTLTGMVMGSPQYMSPEQVTGKASDHRTDIFSLGTVLYETLTGSPPFAGENVHAIMFQIVNLNPPPPSTLNPASPKMLDYIVAKMLAKRAENRYQNADEIAKDLKACADGADKTEMPPVQVHFAEEEDAAPSFSVSTDFDSFEATRQLAILTGFEGFSEPRGKSTFILWTGFFLVVLLAMLAVFML